jgi:hypothetical protein
MASAAEGVMNLSGAMERQTKQKKKVKKLETKTKTDFPEWGGTQRFRDQLSEKTVVLVILIFTFAIAIIALLLASIAMSQNYEIPMFAGSSGGGRDSLWQANISASQIQFDPTSAGFTQATTGQPGPCLVGTPPPIPLMLALDAPEGNSIAVSIWVAPRARLGRLFQLNGLQGTSIIWNTRLELQAGDQLVLFDGTNRHSSLLPSPWDPAVWHHVVWRRDALACSAHVWVDGLAIFPHTNLLLRTHSRNAQGLHTAQLILGDEVNLPDASWQQLVVYASTSLAPCLTGVGVQQLFNHGAASPNIPGTPVAFYRFDAGDPSTRLDNSSTRSIAPTTLELGRSVIWAIGGKIPPKLDASRIPRLVIPAFPSAPIIHCTLFVPNAGLGLFDLQGTLMWQGSPAMDCHWSMHAEIDDVLVGEAQQLTLGASPFTLPNIHLPKTDKAGFSVIVVSFTRCSGEHALIVQGILWELKLSQA